MAKVKSISVELIKEILSNQYIYYTYKNKDSKYIGIKTLLSVARMLNIKLSKDIPIAAVDVDKKTIYFNPDSFNKSYTQKDIEGLICHEVMHVICYHEHRYNDMIKSKDSSISIMDKINNELANVSMDVKINYALLQDGMTLPECGILPDIKSDSCIIQIGNIPYVIKDTSNKSWIDIYDELKDKVNEESGKEGGSSMEDIYESLKQKNEGGLLTNNSSSVELHDNIYNEVVNVIRQEVEKQKNKGNTHSNGIMELIAHSITKKKDYKSILRNRMMKIIRGMEITKDSIRKKPYIYYKDISYNTGYKGNNVSVVVDVSGSMEEKFILNSLNIIYDVCKYAGGETEIISFDMDIVSKKMKRKVNKITDVSVNISKGGTDIRKMLEYLNKDKKHKVRILITDMCDNLKDDEYINYLDLLITDNNKIKNNKLIKKTIIWQE